MRRLRWTVVVLIVAGVLSAAGYLVVDRLSRPFQGYEGEEQFVEVLPGDGPAAIAEKLVAAGVVRDRWTFRLALARSGAARRLQAGDYRFARPLTAAQVVAVIEHGKVFVRSVTFPEGLTVREMGKIFEAHGLGSAASFASAAREAASLGTGHRPVGPRPGGVPVSGDLRPLTTCRRATARADDGGAVPRRLHTGPAGGGARPWAVATGGGDAGIARGEGDREARRAAHRRRRVPAAAAGGDAAPMHPTVIYALTLRNLYDGNLTRANLQVDSPYNTYRYPGLPPGPIAAPSRTSVEAASRPEPVDYLYFVSRNDGSHAFARTLDEHNRNVRRYQQAYFRGQRVP